MQSVKHVLELVEGCQWFSISQGVREGCVLSPWLFNVLMDRVMREVKHRLQGVYSSPPPHSLQMT